MKSACASPKAKASPANYDEAAKWYDRAAQAGVVPAIFRLGTFYEKGLSVKKDVDIARRYYLQAAERGNAKAMHNLAVLDADGGGKGANYKSASQWFRKAADRGVADSQFNLGILYARGIGVEQNLAESFKWFSLAAAQGDADSARKRDDIAKRLDPQSLAAAKLAIQTFTPEPQPDDAINVATPAGGWDSGAGAGRRAKARGQAGSGQAHRRRALSAIRRRRRHIPHRQSRVDKRSLNARDAAPVSPPRGSFVLSMIVSDEGRSIPEVADRTSGSAAAPAEPASLRCRRLRPGRSRRPSVVGRRLHSPDFRHRHPRLPGPVAARGLGLLERPVSLAEHDFVADRQRRPRRRGPRPAALFISGKIGAAAASWFRDRLDEAHLAAGDAVLLSSPGGDLDQAVIMGEIIRSRGLATAVGVVDASGRITPSYCASACVLVYAGGKTRYGVEGSMLGVHRFVTSAPGATPSPTPSGPRGWS